MNSLLEAEKYFTDQFQKDLLNLGAEAMMKYAPIVSNYQNIIIPFEKTRMQQQDTIIFQSSQQVEGRMQLLAKIQQLKAENQKIQLAFEFEESTINDLKLLIEELQRINLENGKVIQQLRFTLQNHKSTIQMQKEAIANLEKVQLLVYQQKQLLQDKYEAKENECNRVLIDCKRDKAILVQEMNLLNKQKQGLREKEDEIKKQQFYLRKQWEQLQGHSNKILPETTSKNRYMKILSRNDSLRDIIQPGFTKLPLKQEAERNKEVLNSPLSKLVKHHNNEIYDLSFNHSATMLATCAQDGYLKLYDIANSKISHSISTNSSKSWFTSIALDQGGERVLASQSNHTVSIFNCHSGKLACSFKAHSDKVNSVSWTNSKQKCATASTDSYLKIWDLEKMNNLVSINCKRNVQVVRSSNVKPMLYTGHSGGSFRIYSISQGSKPVSQIEGAIDYGCTALTLLSNAHQLIAASQEGSTIYLLDFKMNKPIKIYSNSKFLNPSTQVTISPSQNLVLAGNCDGGIYYWNRQSEELVGKVTGHDGAVTALQYHPKNHILATADKKGSLILWQ